MKPLALVAGSVILAVAFATLADPNPAARRPALDRALPRPNAQGTATPPAPGANPAMRPTPTASPAPAMPAVPPSTSMRPMMPPMMTGGSPQK